MTPNPSQGGVGGNDSFGPMTPGGVGTGGNQGNPMTPLTNPMTPSNPLTPGPATPGGAPGQAGPDPTQNGLDPSQQMQNQGGSMSLPPCSPHTPQGSVGNPGGFQSRPDAPLTPSGTPNGMTSSMSNPIRMNGDPLLPPADMDMNAFLQQPDPNKLNMQMGSYNPPRMPGSVTVI